MVDFLVESLKLLVGSGAATFALYFLLRTWVSERIKHDLIKELEKFKLSETSRWSTKYEACLEALNIVNAHYSTLSFDLSDGARIEPEPEFIENKIGRVRACFNNLALTVSSKAVLEAYLAVFDLPKKTKHPAALARLRNAIRQELGFGPIELPPELIYVAGLDGKAEVRAGGVAAPQPSVQQGV